MDNKMDDDEWRQFLPEQQDPIDPDRQRSDENIARIRALLKRAAVSQEKTRKLLATLGGGKGGAG